MVALRGRRMGIHLPNTLSDQVATLTTTHITCPISANIFRNGSQNVLRLKSSLNRL